MSDYIRKSVALRAVAIVDRGDAYDAIRNIQCEDVVPARYGKWRRYLENGLTVRCSNCGSRFETPYRHCPHCGAKMDEAEVVDPVTDPEDPFEHVAKMTLDILELGHLEANDDGSAD